MSRVSQGCVVCLRSSWSLHGETSTLRVESFGTQALADIHECVTKQILALPDLSVAPCSIRIREDDICVPRLHEHQAQVRALHHLVIQHFLEL